jgi:hypothetical protein
MTTYIIASVEAPEITCPAWCVVPKEQHLDELAGLEGTAIHWSAKDEEVSHSASCYLDGTIDESDPPLIWIEPKSDGMPVADAEALAYKILAAVEEARA